MRPVLFVLMGFLSVNSYSQDRVETKELYGSIGGRNALLVLQATQRADGGWQVAGEYVLLPTMVRRFVEGERSPEIGVTSLKEGSSPILFGRPATGELRGTWRDGKFSGTRFGPGGQERERFELSEEFPSMDAYSGTVHCEANEGEYRSSFALTVESGRIRSLDWRSRVSPSEHSCTVGALAQQPMKGGLAAAAGKCRVSVRDLGDFLSVTAASCSARCGSQAYLEPLLVDRRGVCQLLHPVAR
jgi:hypothetical protein